MTASELLKAYKRWGLTTFEVTRNGVSWRDHHRPQSYGDMHGQVAHHTGPYSNENGMIAMLFDGRPDLPGPLCTNCILPNGHVGMIGDGRANHAGSGAANVYSALVRDVPAPAPGPDTIDFNAHTYGDEVLNPGDDVTPYPDVQVEALIRVHAARAEFHNWKGTSTIRHAGLTRRKIDTLGKSASGQELTQDFLQAEVQRALDLGPDKYSYPATKPKPHHKPQEDDPLAGYTLDQIADAVTAKVWNHSVQLAPSTIKAGGYTADHVAAYLLLLGSDMRARELLKGLDDLDDAVRQIVREELASYAASALGDTGPVDGAPLTRDEALQEAGVRAYVENHVTDKAVEATQ